MKFIKTVFITGMTLAALTSCDKDKDPVIIPDTDKVIQFQRDIQPILNSRCISCHNQSHFLNLESCCSYNSLWDGNYIDTLNSSQSYLYLQIKLPAPVMPYNSPPLSSQEIADILQWIEDGAKND